MNDDADIAIILISKKFLPVEKIISTLLNNDDYKIKLLCIMLPKTSGYVKFLIIKLNTCPF